MIDSTTFAKYASDPAAFRRDLLIDVSGSVHRLGDVQDDWQDADFRALDPGLMRCNGRTDDPGAKMRAYLERGRGHSKTSDLAVTCCWALAFATRPLRAFAYAADRDQSRLLRDAMQTTIRLNPWLAGILSIEAHKIVNIADGHPGQGGNLKIETSDVASSFGILPDLLIADELCHWSGDGSLWHSLISSAAKRRSCLTVIISNAGFADSWQWHTREAARTDPDWHFSRLDGPQASWLTADRLAEQRRMLPAIAYRRLWGNEWSTGGGDALTPDDIDAAFIDELAPMSGSERGFRFVAGVDLGLKRDCSAVVVLGVPTGQAGKIRLAHHKLWRPTLGRKIDLIDVELHLAELNKQFRLDRIAFDPWQAESMAQRLEASANRPRAPSYSGEAIQYQRRRQLMREVPPTPNNLREQATLVIEAFQDRRLQLYDCEPLRRDLHKLRVEERQYGVRLTSPRDGDGHGDTFSAFSLALLPAHQLAGRKRKVIRAL